MLCDNDPDNDPRRSAESITKEDEDETVEGVGDARGLLDGRDIWHHRGQQLW